MLRKTVASNWGWLCGEVCSDGRGVFFFLGFGVLGENQELGKDVAYCEQEPPIGWLPQQFCSTTVSSKNHQGTYVFCFCKILIRQLWCIGTEEEEEEEEEEDDDDGYDDNEEGGGWGKWRKTVMEKKKKTMKKWQLQGATPSVTGGTDQGCTLICSTNKWIWSILFGKCFIYAHHQKSCEFYHPQDTTISTYTYLGMKFLCNVFPRVCNKHNLCHKWKQKVFLSIATNQLNGCLHTFLDSSIWAHDHFHVSCCFAVSGYAATSTPSTTSVSCNFPTPLIHKCILCVWLSFPAW